MREILIETDLEKRFLEESSLDRLIMLEVDVIPDDVSETGRARIRVYVLLFFLHVKFNLK